jgi:hypothetical protein
MDEYRGTFSKGSGLKQVEKKEGVPHSRRLPCSLSLILFDQMIKIESAFEFSILLPRCSEAPYGRPGTGATGVGRIHVPVVPYTAAEPGNDRRG